jgi:hemoglobin/transferrin/lactoferrin receptor protein
MLPNPNLQAEYAYNADFGTVFIIEKILKIEFSAYYTHLNNAMVRRNFSWGGSDSIIYKGELSQVQAIQNAAMARVYGLHSGLELKLSNRLLFTNDINFQQGFEEMDNGSVSPSRHAAPFFGISRLQYRLNTLIMETNIQYQGKREYEDLAIEERGKTEIYAKDENGLNYAPSWYTLNFKLQYQVTNWLRINTGIENITDRRYRPYSSGLSGAGRNVYISLNVKF